MAFCITIAFDYSTWFDWIFVLYFFFGFDFAWKLWKTNTEYRIFLINRAYAYVICVRLSAHIPHFWSELFSLLAAEKKKLKSQLLWQNGQHWHQLLRKIRALRYVLEHPKLVWTILMRKCLNNQKSNWHEKRDHKH